LKILYSINNTVVDKEVSIESEEKPLDIRETANFPTVGVLGKSVSDEPENFNDYNEYVKEKTRRIETFQIQHSVSENSIEKELNKGNTPLSLKRSRTKKSPIKSPKTK
jgi:hypothetical protein